MEAKTSKPGNAHFYYEQGNSFHHQGRLKQATSSYKRAIELAPRNVHAYHSMGLVLSKMGELDEAIACYQMVIQLEPDYAAAYNNLGNTFDAMGHSTRAMACYHKAIDLKPDYAEAYSNLGGALDELGKNDEAIASYRKALQIRPDLIEAGINLASILERLHRLDDVRNLLNSVLQRDPNSYLAHFITAQVEYRLGNFKTAEAILGKLRADQPTHECTNKTLFLLGKVYDKLHRYNSAYHAFFEANRRVSTSAKASEIKTEIVRDHKHIKRLQMWFTPERVARWNTKTPVDGQPAPVFLVGFPRSGTTLLEQILSSHFAVTTLDEKQIFENTFKEFIGSEDNLNRLNDLTENEIHAFRIEFWKNITYNLDQTENESLIIDKLPLNIIYLGLIYRFFPEAKVVVALRHPMAVALSNFMQNYKLNTKMYNFLTIEGTAKFYVRVMGLYLHYRDALSMKIFEVRYENIVENFEHEVRNLLKFLELPWTDRMPKFYKEARQRKISTPSYSQVTKPIYRQAVVRWKNYSDKLASIRPDLDPFLCEFGY